MARSLSIHSVMSLELPYGLIGLVGVASEALPSGGMPYTAAVDENTMCLTPCLWAAANRVRLPAVLLP